MASKRILEAVLDRMIYWSSTALGIHTAEDAVRSFSFAIDELRSLANSWSTCDYSSYYSNDILSAKEDTKRECGEELQRWLDAHFPS